jgi:pteridine reductase
MTDAPLRGRAALVTGGAQRIGREIGLTLAALGADIVVHYRRSRREAEELVGILTGSGVRAWAAAADFDRPEEVERLIPRVLETAGRLDFLVNNASIFPAGTLADLDFPDLVESLRVNAWTPFLLGREFARRAGGGKIVNILDTRVDGSDVDHVSYILSKQMLAGLTLLMALELAPALTVNAVAPGLILPPAGKDEAYLDRLAANLPLRRHGTPADVARAVAYLLQADFVTGQVIYVDGGRHVREFSPRPHSD